MRTHSHIRQWPLEFFSWNTFQVQSMDLLVLYVLKALFVADTRFERLTLKTLNIITPKWLCLGQRPWNDERISDFPHEWPPCSFHPLSVWLYESMTRKQFVRAGKSEDERSVGQHSSYFHLPLCQGWMPVCFVQWSFLCLLETGERGRHYI